MKILVLGAGLQGSACAFDLLEHSPAEVTLADYAPGRLPPFLEKVAGARLKTVMVDVRDARQLTQVIQGHDGVLSAVPYYFNFEVARLAVEARAHFADLGGNTDIVRRQETLRDLAAQRGVTVVPDCGVAPGMVNILAVEAMRRLEKVDALRLYVGGLPRHPRPPLNYRVVYSLEGVLDYYTTPSWVLKDGQPVEVEALSDLEEVQFPEPLKTLEAFHTAGGISTMPWTYAGQVSTMEYKTLRYPGHAAIMRAIRGLGLLDTEPVTVKGQQVVPRDLFISAAGPRLRSEDPADVIALRVVAEGRAGGKPAQVRFRVLDHFDAARGISAMMRTTGYSLSVTGLMQIDGKAGAPGVRTAYEAIPFAPYVAALKQRGIEVVDE